jgi:hypothetical protein
VLEPTSKEPDRDFWAQTEASSRISNKTSISIVERFGALLSANKYTKITQGVLRAVAEDELKFVYAHALEHYFAYDSKTRQLSPTISAPPRNIKFLEMAKRVLVETRRLPASGASASRTLPTGATSVHPTMSTQPTAGGATLPGPTSVQGVNINYDTDDGYFCTTCEQMLSKNSFNKKQRKKKTGHRKCIDCLMMESSGAEGGLPSAAGPAAAPTMPESSAAPGEQMHDSADNIWCSACCKFVDRDSFSQNQQARPPRTRRCTSCIRANIKTTRLIAEETDFVAPSVKEPEVEPEPAAAPTELYCSACASVLPLENFSKTQRAKGDSRRCRGCIDAKLADLEPKQEEHDDFDHTVAEDLREQGNLFYRAQDFLAAESTYGRAIDTVPSNAVYWGNRSAARFMLQKYVLPVCVPLLRRIFS